MSDADIINRLITDSKIKSLVRESYEIERMNPDVYVTKEVVSMHCDFIRKDRIITDDLVYLVSNLQKDSPKLRSESGYNVIVGHHVPPSGGMNIVYLLQGLLDTYKEMHPYEVHVDYESIHPFTDGNGRSGRALFYHHCYRHHPDMFAGLCSYGFKHYWYYLSLESSRKSKEGYYFENYQDKE